jgi:hypothetical protein
VQVAFAVGAVAGFPFEVWALFTNALEARRHADGAAYAFEVFPLPVYVRYAETPPALRPERWSPRGLADRAADEIALTAAALESGEAVPVRPGRVFAVGDFDSTGLPEVRLTFAHEADSQRYLAASRTAGTGAQWRRAMPVYGSYDECPPALRYAAPGPALSQLVRPRDERRNS